MRIPTVNKPGALIWISKSRRPQTPQCWMIANSKIKWSGLTPSPAGRDWPWEPEQKFIFQPEKSKWPFILPRATAFMGIFITNLLHVAIFSAVIDALTRLGPSTQPVNFIIKSAQTHLRTLAVRKKKKNFYATAVWLIITMCVSTCVRSKGPDKGGITK